MGYSYTLSGALCCDFCGNGGARKVPCPFNWCQPIAACPSCRSANTAAFGRARHRALGCEEASIEARNREARRAALEAAGTPYLRSAGLLHFYTGDANRERDRGLTRVSFSTGLPVVMPSGLYDRRADLLTPPTLGDFEALNDGRPFESFDAYVARMAQAVAA